MEELNGQLVIPEVAAMIQEHREHEYQAFVDKFKEAKTTDDCYTPPEIYDEIADWVAEEYGYQREKFLRPFKPGGDYQREEYPEGCAVVDNPPFSILASIVDWYIAHKVPFFLFGPTLTIIGLLRKASRKECCCIVLIGNQITYENGATVQTSYVTNMEPAYALRIEGGASGKNGSRERPAEESENRDAAEVFLPHERNNREGLPAREIRPDIQAPPGRVHRCAGAGRAKGPRKTDFRIRFSDIRPRGRGARGTGKARRKEGTRGSPGRGVDFIREGAPDHRRNGGGNVNSYLTPAEAAKVLRISTATITRCKKLGAPVHYVGTCGRFYRINPREFMEWMNAQGESDRREQARKLSVLELKAKRHALCG